jgi:glycosyltransferase involved in cell wall biosynthesis
MMVTIIFPVLNERLRLDSGVTRTVSYLEKIGYEDYEIIIVDNGSEDETPDIAASLCEKYPNVSYERINIRGVGAAFRRGVEVSHGDVVGYMDIDLSTNIKHLGEAIHLFKTQDSIEYINGSRFARESDTKGRKWYRKITSQGLLILLKTFLGMKSTDAICGFTFVRRQTALNLIEGCSDDNGWFYMIEFLLRAEKRGVEILDYPVEWQEDYNTTVKIFKTIKNYLVQIARLYREFYIKKNI